MARDGRAAVAVADVRLDAAVAVARGAHGDERPAAGQLVGLRDEVVLPADAADDAPVREPVGDQRAAERDHHGRVHESRVAALRQLALPARAQQLVREADRHHREQCAPGIRHLAQLAVEGLRAQHEGAVQQHAFGFDAPLQDPLVVEVEEAVHEHLGDGIEPVLERPVAAERGLHPREARAQAGVLERPAPGAVLAMAQRHRVHDGVAQFADADLDRAAVAEQHAVGERDAVVRGRDRQVGRAEQLVVAARVVHDEVEGRGGHLGRAEHERHVAVDLADDRDLIARTAPFGERRQQVHGDVGVGAEARAPAVGAGPQRDLLRDDVGARGQDRARDVRVVDARVPLLRLRRMQPGARLHEEFLDADVCRDGARGERIRPLRVRPAGEHALGHRPDEAPFQFGLAARTPQREPRQDRQFDRGIGGGAAPELVRERHRLAGADRQAQHDLPAHVREHLLHAGADAGQEPRSALVHRGDSSV